MLSNSVRNKDGIWINANLFREEAINFEKNGYYTPYTWGSPAWEEYWLEQRRRCFEGYSVGGAKITGDHYYYLNFVQIKAKNPNSKRKIIRFPDFWDGDYNYFWALSIAEKGISLQEYNNLKLFVKIDEKYLDGGRHMMVSKSRRKGYQQPNSEIIMTPNGKTTMGELKVGDEVLTPTGKAKILEYYPQGLDDVYELTLFDGRTVKCGLEHLWKVYTKGKKFNKIVDTNFLLNSTLKSNGAYNYFLPINESIEYNEQKYSLSPYVLGAFLGDGNVTKQLKLSGIDEEILDKVLLELNNDFKEWGTYKVGSTYKANWGIILDTNRVKELKEKYKVSKFASSVNPVYEILKNFNLNCKSEFKYIPEIYKQGSIHQRFELVRGLMDTDGYIGKDGSMSFSNISKQLVKDLQEVLYSLGIASTFRKRKDNLYIIYINTNEDIFYITRKKNRIIRNRKNRKFIPIIDVKKLDYKEEQSCILIDSEEHLYLTRDYIITHNSYKNASVLANMYHNIRNSTNLIGSYDKKYSKDAFDKAKAAIDFADAHTGFRKHRIIDKKSEIIKSGYLDISTGIPIEKGFLSEIIMLTYQDNPDAARGKDANKILLEEMGTFPNAEEAYAATVDSVKDGDIMTGQMIMYGTSSNKQAMTEPFKKMFNNPDLYDILPFKDIWDDNSEDMECGFFHPVYLNKQGYYDNNGNSDIKGAIESENKTREKKKINSTALNNYIVENPMSPEEAFRSGGVNIFPIPELQRQLKIVLNKKLYITKGQPVNLFYKDGIVIAKPILDLKKTEPIYFYKQDFLNSTGNVIIYEYPIANAPFGLYKIGYDPYAQDQSKSTSLGAIYVYKTIERNSPTKNIIVAQYVGRPPEADDANKISLMLAELYNTETMHENMFIHVKNYYRNNKKLNRLASQPDRVISKNIKESTVSRIYGIHMNDQLKDAGEKYIKDWLSAIRDYDENGDAINNIDYIYDAGLLQELIGYNRKGNFDRVMAMMQVMFQVQESIEEVHDTENSNSAIKEWTDFINKIKN